MQIMKSDLSKNDEIIQLFIKTFTDSEGENEGKIIGDLVIDFMTCSAKEDIFIYIAKENTKIIGCIIFSKMKFEKSEKNAYLLSPVAVHTDYQGKGVGQKLINWAHEDLRSKGAELVLTYGDIKFYSKVGYKIIDEKIIQAPLKLSYPEGWMAQSLVENEIKPILGKTFCIEPINKQMYW